MSNVFISYASADRQNVERFVEALHAANIVGWLDATDIAAGANISSEIRDAIRKSGAVIVFLSDNSLRNQWVQFEIGAAEALGKTIIPVLVAGSDLGQLPDILSGRIVIDARNRAPATVVNEIRRAIEQSQ